MLSSGDQRQQGSKNSCKVWDSLRGKAVFEDEVLRSRNTAGSELFCTPSTASKGGSVMAGGVVLGVLLIADQAAWGAGQVHE